MLLLALASLTAAADDCQLARPDAPPRLHLVTVAPGGDLFSSMGHVALVFSGGGLPVPLAYDWGAYDPSRSDLLPAFLAGQLPYHLNQQPAATLARITTRQERSAVGQELDVPGEAIAALHARVVREALPENRSYTYHWELANCATRARDAIDGLVDGALSAQLDRPVDTTSRYEASRHLWRWPVPAFAWRFITSARLDRPLTAWERTMLPEHLMREVGTVQVDGRPLVRDTCTFSQGRYGWAPDRPPAGWPWTIPGLVGAAAVLGAATTGRTRAAGALIALCGAILCALGLPSLLLWAISDLDGIGPTENWLLAGPQSAVLCAVGWKLAAGRVPGPVGSAAVGAVGALALGVFVFDGLGVLGLPVQANGDIVAALLPGVLASVLAARLCISALTGCGSSGTGPSS